MICEYSNTDILNLLNKQLSFFMLDETELDQIKEVFDETLKRVEFCFAATENKYYSKNGETYFNPYHSGQWCIFLYYLSNSLHRKNKPENRSTCDKIYFLNRMLNSVDLFYEVNLPDIFFLDHPLGTVIGRGIISNYFSFSQNCTVGNNKGIFPVIGENVRMLSGSKILGNSKIGNNVIISANTYIKDQDVDSNTIVFGTSPNLIIKKMK